MPVVRLRVVLLAASTVLIEDSTLRKLSIWLIKGGIAMIVMAATNEVTVRFDRLCPENAMTVVLPEPTLANDRKNAEPSGYL